MNKLTEIKEKVAIGQAWRNLVTLEDAAYLLSLLEEKDKALAFYADIENYWMTNREEFNEGGYAKYPIFEDDGECARKALNTSSNNEGE